MSIREIRIATRKSALALWQAEFVKASLEQAILG
jgi:hydroxymethylbilane synthase